MGRCDHCIRMSWFRQDRRVSIQNRKLPNWMRCVPWSRISGWQRGRVAIDNESEFEQLFSCIYQPEPWAMEMETRGRNWVEFVFELIVRLVTFGSSSKTGSSLVTHGRCGEPNGLYAVTTMPTECKYLLNFCWVKYGWHSTWLVTGLMRHESNKRWVCALLKLEIPMLLVRPASTAFSNSRHVSTKSTDENRVFPSLPAGNSSPSSL